VRRAQGPLVLSDEFRAEAIGYPAMAERYSWAKDPLEPFLAWVEVNRLVKTMDRRTLGTRARALLKRWKVPDLLDGAPEVLAEMAAGRSSGWSPVDTGTRAPPARRTHRIADEYRTAARLLQEWLRIWIDLGYATLPQGARR